MDLINDTTSITNKDSKEAVMGLEGAWFSQATEEIKAEELINTKNYLAAKFCKNRQAHASI